MLQKMQQEIHLSVAAAIHDGTTEDFSSPNGIGDGIKRDTSKTSSELFLSLFSFVPRLMEIPTEIQRVKKRRSHGDW